MIEISKEYRPYFFLASILLGTQIVFLLDTLDGPRSGFFYTLSLLSVAGSVPMLICACLAAMVGYKTQMEQLLLGGSGLAISWFGFALASISFLGFLVFSISAAMSYAVLYFRHKDLRAEKSSSSD